jgi:hypothetical protein
MVERIEWDQEEEKDGKERGRQNIAGHFSSNLDWEIK